MLSANFWFSPDYVAIKFNLVERERELNRSAYLKAINQNLLFSWSWNGRDDKSSWVFKKILKLYLRTFCVQKQMWTDLIGPLKVPALIQQTPLSVVLYFCCTCSVQQCTTKGSTGSNITLQITVSLQITNKMQKLGKLNIKWI